MKNNSNIFRSWKGIVNNLFFEYKMAFKVCFIIAFVNTFVGILLSFIFIFTTTGSGGNSYSNGGAMNITAISALITMLVSAILITSKKTLASIFFFPVNRAIFSFANLVVMAFAAYVYTTMSLALTALELLIGNIFSALSNNFFFISSFSWKGYFEGTITLFMYLLILGSFVYCVFVFIRKNLVISLVSLGIVLFLPIFSYIAELWPIITHGNISNIYVSIFKFFFVEPSLLIFVIKALCLTLFFHALAYLPFRRMEVA